MPIPVKVPKLGMSMADATIVRWLVAVGDPIAHKQPLAEIETDKIVSDLESPAGGVVGHFAVPEGTVASVAQTIAWILVDGESTADIPAAIERVESKLEPAEDSRVNARTPLTERSPSAGSISSPAVRRLARELGVDLGAVVGSGPEGRILKQDVQQVAAQGDRPRSDESVLVPFTALRRAIATTVSQSNAIPQVVLYATANATGAIAARQQDSSISYNDLILAAVSRTLQDHKFLNASYEENGIRLHARANIGIAVSVDDGLVIPVIHGAERLSRSQIASERTRLIDLARSRGLSANDLSGGTFTISNLGMYPVDRFSALINPPQVAILSVGRIQRVAVQDDRGWMGICPRFEFGLTLDHRVVDGAAGGAFLRDFIARFESSDQEAT